MDAAREVRPDIPVKYHSDGKINDLIPDLIEAGVTILNPVQPECVDHGWVKQAYGNRLAFDGGLGVRSTCRLVRPMRFANMSAIRSLHWVPGAGCWLARRTCSNEIYPWKISWRWYLLSMNLGRINR